jgi:hypothetical protein
MEVNLANLLSSFSLQHPTAGRGLFAGLQDMKKYNVEHGWAKRNADASTGLGGWLWNKYVAPIPG